MLKFTFEGTEKEAAAAVKTIRCHRGLSVNEMADLMRVRPDYVRKVEDGVKPVTGPVRLVCEMLADGRLNPDDELRIDVDEDAPVVDYQEARAQAGI